MRTLRTPLSAAAAGLIGLSFALTTSTIHAVPMNVTATVLEACTINAIPDLALGNLTPGGGDVFNSQDISWACTPGTNAEIVVNDGLLGTREMSDGGPTNRIAYELYRNAALNQVWGTGADAISGLVGNGFTTFANVTVYAQVTNAAYLTAPPASYSDTVDVTINVLP